MYIRTEVCVSACAQLFCVLRLLRWVVKEPDDADGIVGSKVVKDFVAIW